MKLRLVRNKKLPNKTVGELYIDGEFFCNTIEDRDRGLTDRMSIDTIKKIKVYAETAIPTGVYKVSYTYSPKFKKKMPLIEGVKGFSGIRIHRGIKPEHSAGCVLIADEEKLKILYKMIEDTEDCSIEIV